jgi:succinyl-diaminopimelate desuccinylase
MSDELLVLAKRLISYETCDPEAISKAAGFVEGWLEARGIEAERDESRGLPVIKAEVGPEGAPTVVLHGHLDVVPGLAGQFQPKVEGDKLYGRGAYDMKGAIAAMLLVTAAMRDQDQVRVRLGIVGDEESEEDDERGSDHLVDTGFLGDFAITGEPTDLHIGIEAKGVLALRLRWGGRPPTAPPPGSATTPSSTRSTFSAVSSRYLLPDTARSCSTDLRSTWDGSSAATLSTRCPTDA